jgi:Exopolysaccharide biosynthesis protein related to N-acetylglucosamine-1-phosphodiester alpha-N-acetylglucosaminidase
MKSKALYFFVAVSIPLLAWSCGGKDPISELPPPVPVEKPDEKPVDPSPGTRPWDANRGKVVTPSGTGWTSKTVDEGVVYYTFSGKDDISGVVQEVFVVDLDLSKSQYQAKLLYTSPRVVVSEAFKRDANTVAAMNANFEVNSIFIRTAGTTRYQIPKTVIGDTDVPNWKSEAAFTSDGERGLQIFFAGSPARDGKIKNIKGKTYPEAVTLQRQYYTSIAGSYRDLISSAPMLIDDYEPLGEDFCDYSLTSTQVNKLDGEDPNRHQRVRHPRTAVALTENNHFIMFVVDGRTNYSSGMSARELTRFLVKWFNPQYALNMDGGGSTTLCVKGEGDPTTHVVNYPVENVSDKNMRDHSHERQRDVHFVIVKK